MARQQAAEAWCTTPHPNHHFPLPQEINSLRRSLEAVVAPGLADEEFEAAAALDAAAALAGSGPSSRSSSSFQPSARVRDAMALVEAALSGGASQLSSLNPDERAQLLALQQENEELRRRAAALAARQAQLQVCLCSLVFCARASMCMFWGGVRLLPAKH